MRWPFWRKSDAVANEFPSERTPVPGRVVTGPQQAGPAGSVQPHPSFQRVTFMDRSVSLFPDVTVLPPSASSAAIEDFAFKLFKILSRSDALKNLFFSPASIMWCLGMIHELATGETQKEIAEAIAIAGEGRNSKDVFALLKEAFRSRNELELLFANSLWCGIRSSIRPECTERLREDFQTEFYRVDFAKSEAADRINSWVNEKTHGRISRIVDQFFSPTALVALNAVYFKGSWREPFKAKFTREGNFTTGAGNRKPVKMMRRHDTFLYYEEERFQAVSLPYRGGMAMYVILPRPKISPQEFQEALNAETWRTWLGQFESVKGTIELPKFDVDYSSDLTPALGALGMRRAFDLGAAELDGIQVERSPVWVDQIQHWAVTRVNEEGTEAAAVTRMGAVLGLDSHARTFQMVVERPFFLAIVDQRTRAIAFIGWIDDPK